MSHDVEACPKCAGVLCQECVEAEFALLPRRVWVVSDDYGEVILGVYASEAGADAKVRELNPSGRAFSSVGVIECEVEP